MKLSTPLVAATVVAAFVFTAPPAQAQSAFPQACGGTNFFSCFNVSVVASNSGKTQTFTFTNLSNLAPASNAASRFALFGVGSTNSVAPASFSTTASSTVFSTACSEFAPTGCSKLTPGYANSFPASMGFTALDFFGLNAAGGDGKGLAPSQVATFSLTFDDAGSATLFMANAQYAVHDLHGPNDCSSGKVAVNASGAALSGSDLNFTPGTCISIPRVVTTPEPSSIALVATGLFGLVPLARRRRK